MTAASPPEFFLLMSLYAKMPIPTKWTLSERIKSVSWSSTTYHSTNNVCRMGGEMRGCVCTEVQHNTREAAKISWSPTAANTL
jgi:hypothetical protein